MFYRNKVINQFHSQLSIVVLVTDSLTAYMVRAHEYAKGMCRKLLHKYSPSCTRR